MPLMNSIKDSIGSAARWVTGHNSENYKYDRKHTTEEKVRTGPSGVILPWFLPYYNDTLKETAIMRKTYRQMLTDPNVKAAVLGKVLAVAALDLRIIPFNKKNERDKMVANFVEFALMDRIYGAVPALVWNICIGALIDGYSVSEKIWGVEDKNPIWKYKTILRKLKPKQVDEEVNLEVDEFWNVKGVRAYLYNSFEVYRPNDFVIFSHLPLYGQPTGMSDLRAAYAKYWLLDTVWKLRAMHLEKRSIPLLMGTYAVPTQRGAMEAALEKAKWSNWISAPREAQVQAIDIAGRSQQEFQAAVQDLREDIFMAIQCALLQALTGGAGIIRGSSEIHKDTSDLVKWFLAESLKAVLNDYENGLIADLVTRNFVDASYPKAVFGGVDDRELIETAQVDNMLHQVLDLSKEEMYEKYGRQPPKNEEDTIPSIATVQSIQMQMQQIQQEQAMSVQNKQIEMQDQQAAQQQQAQVQQQDMQRQQMEQDYMSQIKSQDMQSQGKTGTNTFAEAMRTVQRVRYGNNAATFVDAAKILRNVIQKRGKVA